LPPPFGAGTGVGVGAGVFGVFFAINLLSVSEPSLA